MSQTSWTLAGGKIDNAEMTQEELDATLAASGGSFTFSFVDASAVQMANGSQAYDGTYELVENNMAFHAVFTGYEYYGVFTAAGDQTIMMLVSPTAPSTVLYFSQIAE